MSRKIEEYEVRARECVSLAYTTDDEMLREQLLCLCASYLDYAEYLRERLRRPTAEVIEFGDWRLAHEETVAIGDKANPNSVG